VLTRDVFVPGGTPKITYNPRTERHLETEVQNYLSQGGKALSVSGPTKCGKTVLIAKLLPPDVSIWIQGSDISSAEDLWRGVVDFLGLWDTVEVATGTTSAGSGGVTAEVSTGVVKGAVNLGKNATTSSSKRSSRKRALADVAREALKTVNTPIIIDDFHFVPEGARQDIARAIKSIIPFCPVIMIAVPYDAFEAVAAEPDLGGRVWHLELEPWDLEELHFIGTAGFDALNLTDRKGALAQACAEESFGAPFIMQQLCFDVCTSQSVIKRQAIQRQVNRPNGWPDFLGRIARRTKPTVFQKLLDGAKTRGTERLPRRFHEDGLELDIYGCVLRGIQHLGPKAVTNYSELNRYLQDNVVTPAPTGQQVGNCLSQMHEIADKSRGTGDPAFVYKDERAHVVDPFLLFYLKRGGW
jgi:hypothetical protein